MPRRAPPCPRRLWWAGWAAIGLGMGGARGVEGGPPAPPSAPARPAPPLVPPPAPPPSPTAAAGPATDPALAAAFGRLASPYLLEREEGIATLVRAGPAARPAVLAAWPRASVVVRPSLARVLGEEGSPEAHAALRDALVAEPDPEVARAIVRALLVHPDAAARALDGVRASDGSLPAALGPVESLVRRARVERLFLSRKSRSGSTGSYPGQYDVLRPERALAVEVCLAILRNEAIKEPSVFPGGTYAFLRAPDFLVDGLEVRVMAANAIAELVDARDVKVLDALERLYFETRIGLTDAARRQDRRQRRLGRGALLLANAFKAEEGLLDTGVLPTLARNRPLEWRQKAMERIEELENDAEYDAAAGLCLRLGEYGRAVGYFEDQLRVRDSPVLAHYNIACAYARWALDESEGSTRRREFRARAVRSLRRSVEAGYADWPWIEQDRDLDAIRGEEGYARLLGDLKREYPARGAATAPPEGPTPAAGETRAPDGEPAPKPPPR